MKHIFKKLHIGTTQSDSSSSATATPSLSSSFDQLTTISPTTPTTTATTTTSTAADRLDYFSSEEEFQLQLALAISASNTEFREDPEKDQIRAATLLSLGRHQIGSRNQWSEAAESLSRRYWDYNVLDYTEKVVDGFYDIYGIQTNPASQGKMPSLADIQTDTGDPSYEVVMVNRAFDPALVELEQVAHCIVLDCPSTNVEILVQRLADLVTEHMGGPVKDANIMLVKWMERIMELRSSLHSCILPIGSLNIGLSRHRALLFKMLADSAGIPCRLVKGSHYTGIEDDAVNIVKLGDGREFLVDLMAAPGTLIPADILSTNDASFNFGNPRLSAIGIPGTANVVGIEPLRQGTSYDILKGVRRSSYENLESVPTVSSAFGGALPANMGISSNEGARSVVSAKQPQDFLPSQHEEHHEGSVACDGVNGGHNDQQPYSQDAKEDSKSLFADLNPLQITGAQETSSKNKPVENRDNDFHRWQGKLASGPGRPPLPLAWKKRSACNEVPRTKQYGFVEGASPKNNQSKDYNISVTSSSSSGFKDGPLPKNNQGKNYNVSATPLSSSPFGKSYSNVDAAECCDICHPGTNNNYGDSFGFGNSELMSSKNQLNKLGSGGDGKIDNLQPSAQFRDKDHLPNVNSSHCNVDDETECGKNVANKHGHGNYTHDGIEGSEVMPKGVQSSSSKVVSHESRPDPMLDDVAELEIPWEDLAIGERIGLGSYGEVYHAEWNGMEVAVKKFLDQDFSGDALDEFRSEVRIMRRLRHPNVVLFVGAVTRPPNLSIVTEFLPRGSLYRILHRPNCQLDESRRIKMALDVAKGMNCLHTSMPTIVHRDLKSLNLLVDDNWNVKVCDFGLSRLKHNTFLSSKSTAGTPEWMAPEVLRNEPSNEKCDVFSFGVILWELATLRLPWTGMNQMQVVGAVGFQNRRLDIPKELDPLVATIIRECWQTDPNLRPSFAQLATALKPLERLGISLHSDQQNMPLPEEISVNSTP